MRVEFPPKVWGRLASIADNRGVSIADLIVEAAQSVLSPNPEPAQEPKPAPAGVKTRPTVFDVSDERLVQQVRQLHRLHWSRVEVARSLNVTMSSLKAAYIELGLVTEGMQHRPSLIDPDVVRELHSAGWTDGRIADRLRVSPSAIHHVRHDVLRLPPVSRGGRPRNTNPKESNKQ